MDYTAAVERLGTRQARKVDHNTYLERRDEKRIALRLHSTDILTFHADGRTVFNSGGWQTVTTKDRLNKFVSGVRVYSERGVWFLRQHGDGNGRPERIFPFADGLTLQGTRVTHAGPPVVKTLKARERVRRFAGLYLDALEAGKVKAPGAGDCFYCQMHVADGKDKGKVLGEVVGDRGDHIQSHMKERYFVPSLLANALRSLGASPSMYWWVGSWWDTTSTEEQRNGARRFNERLRVQKALRRYLLGQLGLAR